MTLALRLAHAENALHALTSGQVDAIIDSEGKAYLLRPAQEYFRQNQSRLHTVLDSAADIITVLDRGSQIISQTRAAYRWLGYESGWLLGRRLFDFVHPEDLPKLYSAFINVIEEFRPNAFVEFRHQHRDGTYRTLETMVSKLRDISVKQVVLISREGHQRKSPAPSAASEEPMANPFPIAHPPA
jgi:PAS domain S-box-containing protein